MFTKNNSQARYDVLEQYILHIRITAIVRLKKTVFKKIRIQIPDYQVKWMPILEQVLEP